MSDKSPKHDEEEVRKKEQKPKDVEDRQDEESKDATSSDEKKTTSSDEKAEESSTTENSAPEAVVEQNPTSSTPSQATHQEGPQQDVPSTSHRLKTPPNQPPPSVCEKIDKKTLLDLVEKQKLEDQEEKEEKAKMNIWNAHIRCQDTSTVSIDSEATSLGPGHSSVMPTPDGPTLIDEPSSALINEIVVRVDDGGDTGEGAAPPEGLVVPGADDVVQEEGQPRGRGGGSAQTASVSPTVRVIGPDNQPQQPRGSKCCTIQ